MGMKLTQEQFDRECSYRLACAIMERMMEDELLTPKEYGRIEPILAQKLSPIWAGYPNVIDTMSGDGELMLTILASLAQEESRSVSENCKWRVRKKF